MTLKLAKLFICLPDKIIYIFTILPFRFNCDLSPQLKYSTGGLVNKKIGSREPVKTGGMPTWLLISPYINHNPYSVHVDGLSIIFWNWIQINQVIYLLWLSFWLLQWCFKSIDLVPEFDNLFFFFGKVVVLAHWFSHLVVTVSPGSQTSWQIIKQASSTFQRGNNTPSWECIWLADDPF